MAKDKKPAATPDVQTIAITPPRMQTVEFELVGTAPLMVAKFSAKAKNKIEEQQRAGGTAKSKKNREARNFEGDTDAARHVSTNGWDGVAASAFRNAAIDACRAAGFVMTRAKLAIFCEAEGFDQEDGTPLVKIISQGGWEQSIMPVRNASGVMDLRARPMWREWSMRPRIRFDMDMLTMTDVVNLMMRVGVQVGIGEGRPYGREGAGMGFGLFSIAGVTTIGKETSA